MLLSVDIVVVKTRQDLIIISTNPANRVYGPAYTVQVLELMQMHPKERLRRVILTGIWFNAINVGY